MLPSSLPTNIHTHLHTQRWQLSNSHLPTPVQVINQTKQLATPQGSRTQKKEYKEDTHDEHKKRGEKKNETLTRKQACAPKQGASVRRSKEGWIMMKIEASLHSSTYPDCLTSVFYIILMLALRDKMFYKMSTNDLYTKHA